jgi:hypothetical protein
MHPVTSTYDDANTRTIANPHPAANPHDLASIYHFGSAHHEFAVEASQSSSPELQESSPAAEQAKLSSSPKAKPARKRKRSSSGSQKAPRKNLTELQKRENHIKSEKKRRDTIKDGFDDLLDLVPGAKGMTKSALLAETNRFVQQLERENMELLCLIEPWR